MVKSKITSEEIKGGGSDPKYMVWCIWHQPMWVPPNVERRTTEGMDTAVPGGGGVIGREEKTDRLHPRHRGDVISPPVLEHWAPVSAGENRLVKNMMLIQNRHCQCSAVSEYYTYSLCFLYICFSLPCLDDNNSDNNVMDTYYHVIVISRLHYEVMIWSPWFVTNLTDPVCSLHSDTSPSAGVSPIDPTLAVTRAGSFREAAAGLTVKDLPLNSIVTVKSC